MIKVLFFGRLSDFAQPISCDLPPNVSSISDLQRWIGGGNPALEQAFASAGNRIAVNQVLVTEEKKICDGDEIAFMSPLSGG